MVRLGDGGLVGCAILMLLVWAEVTQWDDAEKNFLLAWEVLFMVYRDVYMVEGRN